MCENPGIPVTFSWRMGDAKLRIHINTDRTVYQIKEKFLWIKGIFTDYTSKVVLIYKCQIMDQDVPIENYKIMPNDEINVLFRINSGSEIIVKRPDKGHTFLDVSNKDTIESVIIQLNKRIHIPDEHKLVLYYHGHELQADYTLKEYGIKLLSIIESRLIPLKSPLIKERIQYLTQSRNMQSNVAKLPILCRH